MISTYSDVKTNQISSQSHTPCMPKSAQHEFNMRSSLIKHVLDLFFSHEIRRGVRSI